MHRALLRRVHARRLSTVPQHAQCVVIGGGIIGTSTAYHLANRGWTDVVLLERHALTAGTTWHAAGLVTHIKHSEAMIAMVKYSRDLFARLEASETDQVGWHQVGCRTSASCAVAPRRLCVARHVVYRAPPGFFERMSRVLIGRRSSGGA